MSELIYAADPAANIDHTVLKSTGTPEVVRKLCSGASASLAIIGKGC